MDTWAEGVKIGWRADILSIFALSALIGKHTLVHLQNGNLWTTINTVSSDHDELLSKCEVHLAYVGNGLFCELKPRLLGTTAVSGTTTQDVNILSGTTRDTTSSIVCGIEETVPSNVLDSIDVKPPIIPDVPEASNITSSTLQVAVIGSITSDAKTLQVLLAANDGKLRQTGVPSTVTATKNIPLPPPVTHEHQHEHTTQSHCD